MKYFSTARTDNPVSFRDAVVKGQPVDKGLYFPAEIPKFEEKKIAALMEMSDADIAFEVAKPYVAGTIPDAELHDICKQSVDFPVPLTKIESNIWSLELFHGPTLAFKDVGAKFLSLCLSRFAENEYRPVAVVVATSGDTGGAVAAAFSGVENVDVFVLYPKDRVSKMQELQLTTNGPNIHAIEVDGSFDDCQSLVKTTLASGEIARRMLLTSANSINVGRWLPQQFYYFFAMKQWMQDIDPVVSVPSGNFGNIGAAMLAGASGLKIEKFIAATNANDVVPRYLRTRRLSPRAPIANDVVPRYLRTRRLSPRAPIATLSNAMDVSNPSNFVRVQELFGYELNDLRKRLVGTSVSDGEVRDAIREVHENAGYLLDPHGAVAYVGLRKYLKKNPKKKGIFLHTAHAAKFDSVTEIIGEPLANPQALRDLQQLPTNKIEIKPEFGAIREILLGYHVMQRLPREKK